MSDLTAEQAKQLELEVLTSSVNLTLSVKDVNVILGILGKFPFDEVSNIIASIKSECEPQVVSIIDGLKSKV